VSGHVELAHKTGATIVYGPDANCGFECHEAKDGESFKIGDVTLKVLHTPGHTPESATYLLLDETGAPHCIFTGDTLFIGDVGRPDLAIKSTVTQDDLAGMLYDSLRNKIMPLPDDIIIYPAHGAGSACGKSMSKETFDTLGHQKKVNYALQPISKAEFIKEVTTGLLPPPDYFAKNAMMNKQGAGNLDEVYTNALKKLTPDEFETVAESTHALVLDTREASVFCKAFIPNSINIGLGGQFAVWAATLITDLKQPLLLICNEGTEEETVMRLARVGFDNTLGYLDGGMEAWKKAGKETDSITSITPEEFARVYNEQLNILDIRKPSEYEEGHIANVENSPLDYINDWMSSIDRHKTYYVHCAGGYRSMIAASILKARGVEQVVNIEQGFGGIATTKVPKNKLITEQHK